MAGFCGSAGAGAADGAGTTLIGVAGGAAGDGGVAVSVPGLGGFSTCGFVRPKIAGTFTAEGWTAGAFSGIATGTGVTWAGAGASRVPLCGEEVTLGVSS